MSGAFFMRFCGRRTRAAGAVAGEKTLAGNSGKENVVSRELSSQVLTIRKNEEGFPEFYVDLEMIEGSITRAVVVTDPTIEIAELLRAIAAHETAVTDIGHCCGEIACVEKGRTFVAGRWSTLADEVVEPNLTFSIPTPGHDFVELVPADLSDLQIKVEK